MDDNDDDDGPRDDPKGKLNHWSTACFHDDEDSWCGWEVGIVGGWLVLNQREAAAPATATGPWPNGWFVQDDNNTLLLRYDDTTEPPPHDDDEDNRRAVGPGYQRPWFFSRHKDNMPLLFVVGGGCVFRLRTAQTTARCIMVGLSTPPFHFHTLYAERKRFPKLEKIPLSLRRSVSIYDFILTIDPYQTYTLQPRWRFSKRGARHTDVGLYTHLPSYAQVVPLAFS